MTALRFKNFSNESFTYSYGGVEETFEAGEEKVLEDFRANHFAKHLIDRELTKKKIMTNNLAERSKLEELCFPTDEPMVEEKAVEKVLKAPVEKKKGKKVVEKVSDDFEE